MQKVGNFSNQIFILIQDKFNKVIAVKYQMIHPLCPIVNFI